VVTHQLQVERRTGKVRRPKTDVLPLCHATNQTKICSSRAGEQYAIMLKQMGEAKFRTSTLQNP